MKTTATAATETTNDTNDRVAAITDDVVELGTLWARYGLEVGRAAVDASARTLAATARLMGHLSEALEPKTSARATDVLDMAPSPEVQG